MGWKQVASDAQGGKMLSTMTMETDLLAGTDMNATTSQEHLLFKREVRSLSLQPAYFIAKILFYTILALK